MTRIGEGACSLALGGFCFDSATAASASFGEIAESLKRKAVDAAQELQAGVQLNMAQGFKELKKTAQTLQQLADAAGDRMTSIAAKALANVAGQAANLVPQDDAQAGALEELRKDIENDLREFADHLGAAPPADGEDQRSMLPEAATVAAGLASVAEQIHAARQPATQAVGGIQINAIFGELRKLANKLAHQAAEAQDASATIEATTAEITAGYLEASEDLSDPAQVEAASNMAAELRKLNKHLNPGDDPEFDPRSALQDAEAASNTLTWTAIGGGALTLAGLAYRAYRLATPAGWAMTAASLAITAATQQSQPEPGKDPHPQ